MNTTAKKAVKHPAAGWGAGGLLGVVILLSEMGVFDRVRGDDDLAPRVAVIESDLGIPARDGQTRLDRIEIALSNMTTLQEERARREIDVYGAIRENTDVMRRLIENRTGGDR